MIDKQVGRPHYTQYTVRFIIYVDGQFGYNLRLLDLKYLFWTMLPRRIVIRF